MIAPAISRRRERRVNYVVNSINSLEEQPIEEQVEEQDTQNTFYRFYRNMKIEFSNFLLDSYTLPLIILASNQLGL